MTTKFDVAGLLDAIHFAAMRHRNQRRKDSDVSPYINHPISLAHLLSTTGGVDDLVILQAAILHDTIEDTETTEAELRKRFGGEVVDIVMEVTDDKELPKQRRKELQVEHAPHVSKGAALVKLADKTSNLRDIASTPPADWSITRRQEHFDWAKRVVDGLPRVNECMLDAFQSAYAKRPSFLPRTNDANWFSMPSAMRGASGFVRVMEEGGIEVELYDHSSHAQSSFGGDVSTIYAISAENVPALVSSLAEGFGCPEGAVDELQEKLSTFLDVESLIEWLINDSGIPCVKRVDFNV